MGRAGEHRPARGAPMGGLRVKVCARVCVRACARIRASVRANVWLLCLALLPLSGCIAGYTPAPGNDTGPAVGTVRGATKTSHSAARVDRIRVATYNIHHGVGADNVLDPGRIAAFLRQVDIALLNEVDVNWARSGFTDQARAIAAAAGFEHYVFGPSLVLPHAVPGRAMPGPAEYGNAVLSRFPITRSERHLLPQPPGREPRSALLAELSIDGAPLTVIATHLGLNRSERRAQAETLAALVRKVRTPVILAGDFNAHPDAPEVRLLTGMLADTHALAYEGPGLTFPALRPTARIDYILTSPDLAPHVLRHEVPESLASDHLPVVAEIAWGGYLVAVQAATSREQDRSL